MQGITTYTRWIVKKLRGCPDRTKAFIQLQLGHAIALMIGMIVKILFMIIDPKHFLARASNKHTQPDKLVGVELYEAIMYPDDNMELVSVLYDVQSGLWDLDSTRARGKQIGRLVNREDRVLLLCPRKLVDVLAKGRQGESMITVEDAFSKWQTKHVFVNRLSAPGQKHPFGSLPDFGTLVHAGEPRDLRLTSHDIFHIRNLEEFLLHCSKLDNIGPPVGTDSVMKSWMVTMPQILSILQDRSTMHTYKRTYWELFRRGHVGSTVYLHLHDAEDPDKTHAQTLGSQAFTDQTFHPHGKDYDINDPQTYFQKFGSLVPPKQASNILLALSFFLRPPELEWENNPSGKAAMGQPFHKARMQTPEVFVASRKRITRTASLSDLTRIATSAVHDQSNANSSSIDVQNALHFLGKTPVQGQLRRTRPTASNDEMDRLENPIYHQTQHTNLGVQLTHGPASFTGEQGAIALTSTGDTPKTADSVRMASAETTGTVRVHMQESQGNGTMPNGSASLNPAAAPFNSSTVPSNGDLTPKREAPPLPNGAPKAPSTKSGNAGWGGTIKYHNGTAHPDSGHTSFNQPLSLDGESAVSHKGPKSPSAGSDKDTEQGGAKPAEK